MGRWSYFLAVIILLSGYCFWALYRSLPPLQPAVGSSNTLHAQASPSTLQWPTQGQSAVGIVDSSILDMHGIQQPVPIASTAKLITALTVLQAKPIAAGQQGPTITLGPTDVALYNSYGAQDGSLVKVEAGEQISEYQMLQTIMLPSANNMADSLAIWAFGSLKNYALAANQYLEDQSIVETHVGSDASGFSPSTTATARDLVRIGELVMQNPVLAQIVAQPTTSGIPVVGNINNVNSLLGSNGIVGIKTGNTDQAGGVFVSASHATVNGKSVTIVTALAGSPGLWQALHDSIPLIQSAQANFKPVQIMHAGSTVNTYKQPWDGKIPLVATQDLSLNVWGGNSVTAQTRLQHVTADSRNGQTVGNVTIPSSVFNDQLSTTVKLQMTPSTPSAWWRLTHPFQ